MKKLVDYEVTRSLYRDFGERKIISISRVISWFILPSLTGKVITYTTCIGGWSTAEPMINLIHHDIFDLEAAHISNSTWWFRKRRHIDVMKLDYGRRGHYLLPAAAGSADSGRGRCSLSLPPPIHDRLRTSVFRWWSAFFDIHHAIYINFRSCTACRKVSYWFTAFLLLCI